MFNGLPAPQEETLELAYPLTPLLNPITLPSVHSERLFINITVNRVCRLFSISGRVLEAAGHASQTKSKFQPQ